MRRRKNFFSADTLLVALSVACLALAIMLVIANPAFMIAAIIVIVVVLVLELVFLQRIRGMLRKLLAGDITKAGFTGGIENFSVPLAALQDNIIIWHNAAFTNSIMGGVPSGAVAIERVVPGFDANIAFTAQGQDLRLGERRFTAYGNTLKAEGNVYFVLFTEDGVLKYQAEEWQASRPCVIYFVIDTYDEVLREMKESERAHIMFNIDLALERYVGGSDGFIRRVSDSRYIAIVEERHMKEMLAGHFGILDEVRKADEDNATVTLSVGVGRCGANLKECENWARQALDMALGRGGDQAAVKNADGYEFYGGVTHSVEKHTKVKSRIVAAAIRDTIADFDKVLIMGHKNSDMDSVGAAVGMLRFCRICKKPAAIVIDPEKSLADSLIGKLRENGYAGDLLTPQEAMPLTGAKTLLIVCDTHIHYLLESADVLNNCGGVVIIDHHRRIVGHIDNALVFYHEPSASSASELVAELLQYVGDEKTDKPLPLEAEALLAGIMLDTRTFSLNVGARTFEAAAWLRRMGAGTAAVKKLFTATMNEYLYKSHLVAEAKIFENCAVTLSDRVPQQHEVVAPQAADELLLIEGVQASIVGVLIDGVVRVSARSMGEVNVQLIMEKVGGGGHLTMAGTQMKDISLDVARELLRNAISEYMAERAHNKV